MKTLSRSQILQILELRVGAALLHQARPYHSAATAPASAEVPAAQFAVRQSRGSQVELVQLDQKGTICSIIQ